VPIPAAIKPMLSMTIEDGSGTVELPAPAVKLPFVADENTSEPPLSSVKGPPEIRRGIRNGANRVTQRVRGEGAVNDIQDIELGAETSAGRATAARIVENVRILVVKRIRQRSHRNG
jgi:hypothetical protein